MGDGSNVVEAHKQKIEAVGGQDMTVLGPRAG